MTKGQGFYTQDDVKIVENLGDLIGEVLKTRQDYSELSKLNKGMINLVQEQNATWKLSNSIMRRQNMSVKLVNLLSSQPTLNKKLLKLTKDVMDCAHISFYISNNGSMIQYLTCGDIENPQRIMRILEYCCQTHQEALNIRDLTVEPLIDLETPSALNSCLMVPILLKSGLKAVLCLMRESKEFSRVDQGFANEITKELKNYKNFIENSRITISLSDPEIQSDYLRKFSIPQDNQFDFYQFFYEIKVKLGNWFNLSSCSVYVADQKNEQLWTRNSNSSSSLLFPHNAETLIGRTYEYGEIINLPNPKYFVLTDLAVFKDKFVISLPVCSESFKDPVIGVLVCTRKERNFSDFESWALEKFSESLADIFEQIFINNLPNYFDSSNLSKGSSIANSPNSMFREANKSIFLFPTEQNQKKPLTNVAKIPVLSISAVSQQNLHKFQAILAEVESKRDPIIYFNNLAELANCTKAAYFTITDFNSTLENIATNERMPATAFFKQCLEQKSIIYLKNNAVIMPKYFTMPSELSLVSEDYMHLKSMNSIMLVPVFNKFSSIVGVLQLVNFMRDLEEQDIKFIESIGMYCWLLCIDVEGKRWQEVIRETRGQHSLQQWSRILIRIANNSITKMLVCKNAIYQLVNCNDVKEIMRICIDVICAATDGTQAEIYLDFEGSVCKITNKDYHYLDLTEKEYEEFSKHSEKKSVFKEPKTGNTFIPLNYKDLTGYLKIENKTPLIYKKYVDYRVENEEVLMELCRNIAVACYSFPETNESTLRALSECIKMIALQYRPFALNCVINNAAKSLTDSERASFYGYKDKKLTVQHQGNEHEIPKNFIVSDGKGIVSHVFNNRKAEILHVAYNDDRFDPIVDKLTGYKTESLICVPLITDFDKFGAIEVINKRNGQFGEKDLKLLEKFGEVVCMVLEIINTMHITLEERFRLLAISNTMENYILVFNEHRNLVYINKPIDKIFGVTQEQIMNLTYFAWLHGNKGLMEDLQSVFENSALHIRKTSQKIKIKKQSAIRNITHTQDVKTINYKISHLQNFSSECFSGVILIIEDATALESLHKEFKEVQKEIRIMASPIGTDTKLQKCIRELSVIFSHADNPEMKESLNDVITRLKGGGLKKPKLRIEGDGGDMSAITSILGMSVTNGLAKIPSHHEDYIDRTKFEPEVKLAEVRNWDLNSFAVTNQFDYIYFMLYDFDLINPFAIDSKVLYNFVLRIKEKSNQWNNPFHNFTHCFNVMHGVYMLLSITPVGKVFNPLQHYALLIAAMCHDVDHRGKGNMFEVYSKSAIATVYHDKSVLEQHHAAVTFFTLQEENCNIFSELSGDEYKQVRKLIITSILGTDMSKHLVMVEHMASRFKDLDEKPIGTLEKDIEKVAQLALHAGDLSHPCKSFRIYEMWSTLVCQEFIDQYNQEVKLGLPITQFMKDLDKPRVYYANEVGFLNFVVKPLWECVHMFASPSTNIVLEGLNANITTMKGKLEEWKKAEGVDNKS